MEKFEILRKLPNGDPNWANAVGKNGTSSLGRRELATTVKFAKNAVSVKHDKAKCNQTKRGLLVISFVGRKS